MNSFVKTYEKVQRKKEMEAKRELQKQQKNDAWFKSLEQRTVGSTNSNIVNVSDSKEKSGLESNKK